MSKHLISVDEFTAPTQGIQQQIVNVGAKFVEIRVIDPRDISQEQRRKAWAIIGDIAHWSGHPTEWIHDFMKHDYCIRSQTDYFSLSNCDMTTARRYITYLIDFCICWNVPLRKSITELCDDMEAALYSSLLYKRCIICGGNSDLHHVDKVGQGRDRKSIIHEGMRVQPLCRVHHNECHQIGQQSFDKKYHLISYRLDKYLCQEYGLGYEAE